jgi:hypothetical protein
LELRLMLMLVVPGAQLLHLWLLAWTHYQFHQQYPPPAPPRQPVPANVVVRQRRQVPLPRLCTPLPMPVPVLVPILVLVPVPVPVLVLVLRLVLRLGVFASVQCCHL